MAGLIIAAYAHEGATGVVKQRMDSMSEMGDAVKVIADMIKGKAEYNIEEIRASTQILSNHAAKVTDYFPDTEESRNSKVSEALPAIWESWDRFEKLSNDLEAMVSDLEEQTTAKLDKRALRIAFAKATKACSACHDDFRKPKD